MAEGMSIQFRGVSKSFRRGDQQVPVLERLDLDVEAGEFIALMGPSGSGKSTLLNLVAGLDRPTQGTVQVGDDRPAEMSGSGLCKWRSHHIGFIFQRYHLFPVLTAAKNVEMPLMLFGLSSGQRKQRVKAALEVAGIAERAQHRPRELSGGQEQRVAIARAIVTDPTIILADEPTGDLDTRSAEEILDLLGILNKQLRKTIVMVTHDPKASKHAKRVLHLEKGLIYQEDPA